MQCTQTSLPRASRQAVVIQAVKGGKTGLSKQIKKAEKKIAKTTGGWVGEEGGASDLGKWYGANRALFLPDGIFDRANVPDYMDGTLAGDYGYDPLKLGKDKESVERYRVNELIHGRWAMLGAAGAIIPEGLQANGANIKGGVWYETGAEMLNGGTLNYFAVPWGIISNPLPLFAIIGIEVVLIGAAENYRRSGSGPSGYSPGVGKFDSSIFDSMDNLYPGGPFDPLGLANDPDVFEELKVKEIKNGRLAMVSMLAFAVQAAVTGEGPYANWSKHVSDPFGYNLVTILSGAEEL